MFPTTKMKLFEHVYLFISLILSLNLPHFEIFVLNLTFIWLAYFPSSFFRKNIWLFTFCAIVRLKKNLLLLRNFEIPVLRHLTWFWVRGLKSKSDKKSAFNLCGLGGQIPGQCWSITVQSWSHSTTASTSTPSWTKQFVRTFGDSNLLWKYIVVIALCTDQGLEIVL